MRIAIVNDLEVAVEALKRALATAPKHTVAWVAKNGLEAVRLCEQDRPDMILMDLIMPVMDGVEATRVIMTKTPCPILLVTATVDGNASKVYEALGAGALDAVNTPIFGLAGTASGTALLLNKIDLLEKLTADPARQSAGSGSRSPGAASARPLVAMGASAGGPAAVATILQQIPAGFPAAIVLVQHVDAQFAAGLAQWLSGQSKRPVTIAREEDQPQPGKVLMAGLEDHLVLKAARSLGYTPYPKDYPYRPSIDTFFESVVRYWDGPVVGVLLTGMGRDGANGLKMLRDAGHHTIVQDEATCAVYDMPKAAVSLNAVDEILPLEKIAPALTGFDWENHL